MQFNSGYSDRVEVLLICEDETRTKQDQADACNINNIMKKYQKTGLIDHVSKYHAHYGDASRVSYEEAFNTTLRTNEVFSELPSTVRAKYDNDPAIWLGAIEGAETPEQFREIMGLPAPESPGVVTPAPEAPAVVPPVGTPPAAPGAASEEV